MTQRLQLWLPVPAQTTQPKSRSTLRRSQLRADCEPAGVRAPNLIWLDLVTNRFLAMANS